MVSLFGVLIDAFPGHDRDLVAFIALIAGRKDTSPLSHTWCITHIFDNIELEKIGFKCANFRIIFAT